MNYAAHQATPEQLARIRTAIAHAMQSPFYRKKFAGFDPRDLKTVDDLRRLPFSDKSDLREAYPMGLAAVPEADIVRIHSSSDPIRRTRRTVATLGPEPSRRNIRTRSSGGTTTSPLISPRAVVTVGSAVQISRSPRRLQSMISAG